MLLSPLLRSLEIIILSQTDSARPHLGTGMSSF